MTEALIVLTTAPSRDEAVSLAHKLVDEKIAACVQIEGPITSVYRWDGELDTAEEWRCVVKTTRAQYNSVETKLRSWHSYDVPQIIAVPIDCGSAQYLNWLLLNTSGDADG